MTTSFSSSAGRIRRFDAAGAARQAEESGRTVARRDNRTGIPDQLRSGIEGLSGLDLSSVRVDYGSPRPGAMGALATTQGTRIALGPGQERHLPHEAWHVVQQMQGRVRPSRRDGGTPINDDAALEREADVMGGRALRSTGQSGELRTSSINSDTQPVQRRLPDVTELEQLLDNTKIDLGLLTSTTTTPTDSSVHAEGLRILLRRTLSDIRAEDGPGDTGPLMTFIRMLHSDSKSIDEVVETGNQQQLLTLARNVVKIHGSSLLLPPEGYLAPPANDVELSRIRDLVNATGVIFDEFIGGTKDGDLTEIFGATNVQAAKDKMKLGKATMLDLFNKDKIVTDRSGYSGQVNLGGMSKFGVYVLMPAGAVDKPGDAQSKATMFHEAMHAGNVDVKDDGGYVGSPGFKEVPAWLKLLNAAHFEALAHRHLEGVNVAWSGEFVEPGAVGGSGKKAPDPTQTALALRRTSEIFRRAWTASLWLHDEFLDVYKDPKLWATWGGWLTAWSPTLGLTIHARPGIDATSPSKAKKPVTQIDMALVESMSKRFSRLGQWVPRSEVDAYKLGPPVYPPPPEDFWKLYFTPEEESDALAEYLLRFSGISTDAKRDKVRVDQLCAEYSRRTGQPTLAEGVSPMAGFPK